MLDAGKSVRDLIPKSDCHTCNILTEDQRLQLSTPSYRIKKEKRESKKQGDTPQKSSDSSSLIDPSTVTVVGAVDDQGMLQSPGSSSGAEKKKKDKKPAPEKPKSSKSKSTDPKPSKSSADNRIDKLDKKWADRFNRLEALLLAKSIEQPEPTFQAPKVTPTHPPPVGAVKSSAPFIRPSTDQPTKSDLSGTGYSVAYRLPPNRLLQSEARVSLQWIQIVTVIFPNRPPVNLFVEEGELSRIRLPTPTKYCLKNRPTEKPSEVFVRIWVGTRFQM